MEGHFMKKKLLLVLTFGALLLSQAPIATALSQNARLAQSPAVTPNQPRRCDVVENNISARKIKLDEQLKKRIEIYEQYDDRIGAILEGAQKMSMDTTKANEDLRVWRQVTEQLKLARESLMQNLDEVELSHCNNSQDEFNSALAEAKTVLVEVKALHNQKLEYFRGTLVPELQILKEQLSSNQ